MNVSVKHVNLTNDSNNITKAIATICIDESFNVEGVTVKRSKEDNLYVQLPQRSYYDKETQEKRYKDACYPTNKETREEISKVVLDAYNEKLKEREENVQRKTKNSLKNAKSKDEEPEEEETL
jgi:DNA-binding cell septation regulator SpoVG